MSQFMRRARAAWHALFDPPLKPPARVGVLNTGELIVITPEFGQLILSPETTDLVRDTLDSSVPHLVHPLGGAADDGVHRILQEARHAHP